MVSTRYYIFMSENVISLLSRLGRIINSESYNHRLKPVQWSALRFLAHANRFSRTPSGLTAWLGLTKGTVSQTIAALERKGLIARGSKGEDRRVVRLELTAAAQVLLASDDRVSATTMLNALPNDDMAELERLLTAMLRAHVAERGNRTMGLCAECRYFDRGADGHHHCALLDVSLDDADAASICVEQVAA
jgi:DNA-binding MarR family transcriptional regulator